MKKIILCILPLTAVLYLASCNNNDRDNDNNGADTTVVTHDTVAVVTTPDTTGNYQRMQTERNTYRTDVNRRIDSLKTEINERDKDMSKSTSKMKSDWQKTKANLNRQIDSLQADMNTAGNRADNDWQDFKTKVDREMDTLQTQWRDWKDRNLKNDKTK